MCLKIWRRKKLKSQILALDRPATATAEFAWRCSGEVCLFVFSFLIMQRSSDDLICLNSGRSISLEMENPLVIFMEIVAHMYGYYSPKLATVECWSFPFMICWNQWIWYFFIICRKGYFQKNWQSWIVAALHSCRSDVDQSFNLQVARSCCRRTSLRIIVVPTQDFPGTSRLGVPCTQSSPPLHQLLPSSWARGGRRRGRGGGEGRWQERWWWGQCCPSRRWWRPKKDTRAKWELGMCRVAKNWLWS